ncbi:MAG: tetratricopeptide repeat protein, partial [Hymenobacteraceae bacterium]|nr:tetratricopeptide repeat protein [Hymenobacteraceae bacterium]
MKFLLILLLTLSLPLAALAAPPPLVGLARIDSLRGVLARHPAADTARVKLLLAIGTGYPELQSDSGLHYAAAAERLARRLRWPRGVAGALLCAASSHTTQSNNTTALRLAQQAARLYWKLGDKRAYSRALRGQSNVLYFQGSFTRQLEVARQGLAVCERLGDSVGIAGWYQIHGLGYVGLGLPQKGLGFLRRSLSIYQRRKLPRQVGHLLLNIGLAYQKLGNPTRALGYYAQALPLIRQAQSFLGMQSVFIAMATSYTSLRRYDEALAAADSCYRISKRLRFNRGLAGTFVAKGDVYRLRVADTAWYQRHPVNQATTLAAAIGFYQQALGISTGDAANLEIWRRTYQGLYQTYHLLGRDREALAAYVRYTAVQDSVFSREAATQLATTEADAALALKDREIKLGHLTVRRQQERQGYLLAGLAL